MDTKIINEEQTIEIELFYDIPKPGMLKGAKKGRTVPL
jgi:hypothetical protein